MSFMAKALPERFSVF